MANGVPMRNLLSLMQKRILSTSSSSSSAAAAASLSPDSPLSITPSSSLFAVQYLINSCGLTLDSALKVSQNFRLHENNLQRFQSVFNCFKSHNISSIRVTKLIQRRPEILHYEVENILKPKLQLLVENGIKGTNLAEVVEVNPVILDTDLDSQIKPCLKFLKSVLGGNGNVVEAISSSSLLLTCDLDSQIKPCFKFLKSVLGRYGNVLKAIKRSSQLLTCDLKGSLKPNVDFLIKEGVPFDRIAEFLIWDAVTLQHKHNSMVNAVHNVKNWGLDPKDPVFLEAVRVRIGMSESVWKDKIEVMKSQLNEMHSTSSSPAAATLSPDSLLSSSPSSLLTLLYLVNSCGLALKSALEVSQNFQPVFHLFESHNIPSISITKLIKRQPQILDCHVENNLKPKLQFLVKNGITGHHLWEVFVSNPVILDADLDSQIKPCFQFLKFFLGRNRNAVKAIKRSSRLLTCDLKSSLQPNVDFLIKEGVPVDRVAKFLIRDAVTLQQQHNTMVNIVHDLKNFGLDPKPPVFLLAVRVRIHLSESIWKDKIEGMRSLGWSEEEIFSAIKRDPNFLYSPLEKIRVVTDFFVNTLKLGRQILIDNPEFFSFEIDKTCRWRYDVLKLLESEGELKGM